MLLYMNFWPIDTEVHAFWLNASLASYAIGNNAIWKEERKRMSCTVTNTEEYT